MRLGLGVGVVAHMAYDPVQDADLTAIEVGHLFAPSITKVVLRRDMFLRDFLYDFINMFAPQLSRELIDQAMHVRDKKELEELFKDVPLPLH